MQYASFKQFLNRFRLNIKLGLIGASYDPPPSERAVLLELLAQLGDRRILSHSCSGFHRCDMKASITKVREALTAALKEIPESVAAEHLRVVRTECQNFQTYIDEHLSGEAYAVRPTEDFYVTIGEFRSVVGQRLAALCDIYDIAITDDETRILQARNG